MAAARLNGPTTLLLSAACCSSFFFWAGSQIASAQTPAPKAQNSPAGVEDSQRAWQHWTLNCQGCHRPDGTGSAGTAPSLAGTVARFLSVPGGREYLGRVPGVATSPLSDADLAEVVNWMLWRFDEAHLPKNFRPFTAAEMGRLRGAPLAARSVANARRFAQESG